VLLLAWFVDLEAFGMALWQITVVGKTLTPEDVGVMATLLMNSESSPRLDPSAAGFRGLLSGRRGGVLAALARLGLAACSFPYGLGVWLRNTAYDRGWRQIERAGVPVISVGNLTTGGTGKTPAVEYICRFYRGLDLRVAVLSRGYGVHAGRNDEALVLEENLPDVPHLQGADRAALTHIAVEELESEVLVLDDGFQHRRLHRDVDIVLIDATLPWGHGWLIPRGLLREPAGSLRRAHLALLTRCDQVSADTLRSVREAVRHRAPHLPMVESIHAPCKLVNAAGEEEDLAGLADRPVAAFCGLGNPEAFADTLRRLAADVGLWRTFPDHHAYTREDVANLGLWASQLPPGGWIVTTQKDLVKLRVTELAGRPLWALRIALVPTIGRELLETHLKEGVREQGKDSGQQYGS